MNPSRLFKPDYSAHPILDPDYLQKEEQGARALYKTFFEIKRSPEAYNAHLNRLLRPWNEPRPLSENQALVHSYLREVDLYLRELMRLIPAGPAGALMPLPAITNTNDFMGLMQMAFLGSERRERFEAQRKLYLAKLFFDVDHSIDVQTGPEHVRMLEECLERELWRHAGRAREITVSFEPAPDGLRMHYAIGAPAPGQESWQARLRRVKRPVGGRDSIVHVFYYACRFKRQYRLRVAGESNDSSAVEEMIWAELQRGRSGSIVSKMIRKGEADPQKIGDLIGAMFIVKDASEVSRLMGMLYDIFGGPLRWREDVDTIASADQRSRLNEYSGLGFQVKKSVVGVLYQPPASDQPPYLFNVEFQIYTLEGFLRTVHSAHFANHQMLKQRQFLEGLLPFLFPMTVYGESPVLACFGAGLEGE